MTVDGHQLWRPSRRERAMILVCGSAGLIWAILTIVGMCAGVLHNMSGDLQSISWGAILAAMGVAIGIRQQIVLTTETLTVRTLFRTRWFLVSQIEGVRTDRWGIKFTLKGGQKVRSCLGASPTTSALSQQIREIEGEVLTAATRARAQRSGLILPPGASTRLPHSN